jgi:uncharacterized protein (DUF58 family)
MKSRLLALLDRAREGLAPSVLRRRVQALERRVGITRTGELAILGGIFLWIVARVVAGTAMYLFAYGAILMVVLAAVVTPRRLKLEGRRDGLFPRVREGDRLDVELGLTARRRLATFVLEERVPERLGRTVRVPVSSLGSGKDVTHRYGLRATRRGVYDVGPLVAIAGDPLGLAQRETVVAEPFELLVHPNVELVSDRPLTRQFEDPPIRPPVSKPWPSGLEFYGMREYVPGDDLRRIVWRASARTGRTMVREAEQGITDKVTIVLDTNRTHHSHDGPGLSGPSSGGYGTSDSFEVGVRAAASLGVRHLREGYEVKVLANDGWLTRALRGSTSQLLLLDALARVQTSRSPIGGAVRTLLTTGSRDAHNIFITPHLTAEDAAQIQLLLRTGVSVLVVGLIWDDTESTVMGVAASLGCQVAAVHPGQDLATALYASTS